MKGWIGVDLDGTVARYDGWIDELHIGPPLVPTVDRVRRWILEGKDVRTFTARICDLAAAEASTDGVHVRKWDLEQVRNAIQDWTEEYLGSRLPITNVKDYTMIELWDDTAIRVLRNVGTPCMGCVRQGCDD